MSLRESICLVGFIKTEGNPNQPQLPRRQKRTLTEQSSSTAEGRMGYPFQGQIWGQSRLILKKPSRRTEWLHWWRTWHATGWAGQTDPPDPGGERNRGKPKARVIIVQGILIHLQPYCGPFFTQDKKEKESVPNNAWDRPTSWPRNSLFKSYLEGKAN